MEASHTPRYHAHAHTAPHTHAMHVRERLCSTCIHTHARLNMTPKKHLLLLVVACMITGRAAADVAHPQRRNEVHSTQHDIAHTHNTFYSCIG